MSGILAASLLMAMSLWGAQRGASAATRTFVAKDVTADILPPPMYLIELRLVLSQATEGSMPIDKAVGEAARLEKEYQERIAYWTANPPYGLEAQLLGAQHQAGQRFIESSRAVLKVLKKGDAATAQSALKAADAQYLKHREGVDETVRQSTRFADDAAKGFDDTLSLVSQVQWTVFLAAALALGLLGRFGWKSIWASIGGEPAAAAAVAQAVASGDLRVKVEVAPGDTGSIMAAMRTMCERLTDVVDVVRASSDSIATGSRQISMGNADLSQRTEEQATNLQQTASSMQKLSSNLEASAQAATGAVDLVTQARDAAQHGKQVVDGVVSTMEDIARSSREIGEIVAVIDGIAFQTNLLALNAAVEAARAGEQGRGFAVVAGEVRALAQRSSEAARQIRTLIGGSSERAERGSSLVQQAGNQMGDIFDRVHRVADLIAQIEASSSTQSTGVHEMNQAMVQLDHMTQSNAALVEESAAATESLSSQARRLVDAVGRFKLPAA
ncbi:methyl-accepting chemotaxis protein [Piscinibacter terrae]|uniref:methyl-accepting chemotaxis protein n=1 Tax=Piscinibacter terrae TaxID=2496871 RepID=UPI000F593CBA|nr:methyl-accepting chemotaxis protein [Albitalea terrae]